MRLLSQFALFGLLPIIGLAQTRPNLAGILSKLSEAYKESSQYKLVMDMTFADPITGKRETAHKLIAVKAPDRYRLEDNRTSKSNLIVLDGTNLWFYDPGLNQYASYPAKTIGEAIPEEMKLSGIDFVTMSRYRKAAKEADLAKFLREEPIEIGGVKVSCYVVSSPVSRANSNTYIWWIDKATSHVVREDFDGTSTIFTTIQLGGPLAAGLFEFTPPAGAQNTTGH
jgi:outer membrane lipoprotein-sorting protein